MRVFKTRLFSRWADDEGLNDTVLAEAVHEIERGLVDARLGGSIIKKRVALPGRGKRGGSRTLLAYQAGAKAFFVFGFTKNERANISRDELKVLKLLAAELLDYNDAKLEKAKKADELVEIEVEDNG